MTVTLPGPLVSTEWLAGNIGAVKILDCTWHHASTKLDGRTQYRGRHLPGSVHFDIDSVCDPASPLPHMLPSAADFSKKVGLMGVADGDPVVVYDRNCGGSAAGRVWWMFRVFGYENVALLDGGFGKWTKEKLPTEMSPVRPAPAKFTAAWSPALVRDKAAMLANLASGAEQVVDARGPGRYAGTQTDVFPFKRQGHIPNAINVPWGDLIEEESGVFVPTDKIEARFKAAGVDLQKPITATCASGITSCMLALGLHLLGRKDVAVYDGSWAEWSVAEDAPVAA